MTMQTKISQRDSPGVLTRVLSRFQPDGFVLALIGTVTIATLLPCRGTGALIFHACGSFAIASLFFLQGARGTVEDCEIAGQALAGVAVRDEAAPTLRRCTIRDVGGVGVLAYCRPATSVKAVSSTSSRPRIRCFSAASTCCTTAFSPRV